jgi:hypothetical protein
MRSSRCPARSWSMTDDIVHADSTEHDHPDAGAGIVDAPDTGFGPDATVPEVELLAGLDRSGRAALANKLAGAWLGNLTRPESDDDALLDAAQEQLGFSGLVTLFSSGGVQARRVAAVLGASHFLFTEVSEIRALTRYRRKTVEGTAEQVNSMLLHGDLGRAEQLAAESLGNLDKTLEHAEQLAKRNAGRRQRIHTLRSHGRRHRNRLAA